MITKTTRKTRAVVKAPGVARKGAPTKPVNRLTTLGKAKLVVEADRRGLDYYYRAREGVPGVAARPAQVIIDDDVHEYFSMPDRAPPPMPTPVVEAVVESKPLAAGTFLGNVCFTPLCCGSNHVTTLPYKYGPNFMKPEIRNIKALVLERGGVGMKWVTCKIGDPLDLGCIELGVPLISDDGEYRLYYSAVYPEGQTVFPKGQSEAKFFVTPKQFWTLFQDYQKLGADPFVKKYAYSPYDGWVPSGYDHVHMSERPQTFGGPTVFIDGFTCGSSQKASWNFGFDDGKTKDNTANVGALVKLMNLASRYLGLEYKYTDVHDGHNKELAIRDTTCILSGTQVGTGLGDALVNILGFEEFGRGRNPNHNGTPLYAYIKRKETKIEELMESALSAA